jgi:hypothetical protein
MLQILKNIEGKLINNIRAELASSIVIISDIQGEDYINFTSFTGLLQNFTRAESVEYLDASPEMGIKNNNYKVVSIEISY